ncbi:DEAD/DEAH box helicase [Lysinibacillus sp. 54212]|uniref:DEAD/DEAH box helicase n=1 Tax=Lysinibacillus sp. 54212 TaxID=3119829 RepID=UPI002FC5CB04
MLNHQSKRLQYKGLLIEPSIQHFFSGRIWSRETSPFPQEKINRYIHHGYFRVLTAIDNKKESLECNRCHNKDKRRYVYYECARCQKICVYCRHCINMGRLSSCTELIIWNGPQPKSEKRHRLAWEGQFTKAQQQASEELSASLQVNRHHLLHAVCGAGKTEVLFTAIYKALSEGKRVCVATPRTDVVLELFPRLQQAFPGTRIHALYANSPSQHGFGQLIVTTTHQLYRFQEAFDVMIVDEADAFPYTFDEALQKAVMKAKTKIAPIAFVTATPSQSILGKVKSEGWGYSFIPKRYHGFPLPVPRFEALWSYSKQFSKGKIPKKLALWTMKRIEKQEPFLIFFPTVNLMEQATPLFQRLHEGITSVHAEDDERKEKVLQLRNEKIPGLLTTTILERGITIKNVHVTVIGAESKIFTSGALIQISGRVGRNSAFPDGDVIFFHQGITVEMDEAKEEIERYNLIGFGGGSYE